MALGVLMDRPGQIIRQRVAILNLHLFFHLAVGAVGVVGMPQALQLVNQAGLVAVVVVEAQNQVGKATARIDHQAKEVMGALHSQGILVLRLLAVVVGVLVVLEVQEHLQTQVETVVQEHLTAFLVRQQLMLLVVAVLV